jgi:hypothetical protein
MRAASVLTRARKIRMLMLVLGVIFMIPAAHSGISLSAQTLPAPSIPAPVAASPKPSLSWSIGTPVYRDLIEAKTSTLPQVLSAQAAPKTRFVDRLLRFEIITLGSFPIMLFYTDVGFSIGTYIASGFDPASAPWPFGSASATMDTQERLVHIAVGVALSCTVALFDLIKNLTEEAKTRNRSNLDRVSGSY